MKFKFIQWIYQVIEHWVSSQLFCLVFLYKKMQVGRPFESPNCQIQHQGSKEICYLTEVTCILESVSSPIHT